MNLNMIFICLSHLIIIVIALLKLNKYIVLVIIQIVFNMLMREIDNYTLINFFYLFIDITFGNNNGVIKFKKNNF